MSADISTQPLKVTAIVYSAKGLKARKKDKHKFCVIISVGSQKEKFRTDIVEDLFGNPTFNTECEITVEDSSQPLVLLVTEKHEKDVLGQVIVPLSDLVTFRTNRSERVVLQPHKKSPQPQGELVYEAWISAGSQFTAHVPPTSSVVADDNKSSFPAGFKKLRDKLSAHSPLLSRKSSTGRGHQRNGSDSLFPLKPKVSMSCHDLTSLTSYGVQVAGAAGSAAPVGGASPNTPRLSVAADTDSLYSIDSNTDIPARPEVTGISPMEGPAEGGTKLTIRGSNLGVNKADVVGLYVCGSNVLSSLEYYSASKLVCSTKSHRACSGNIAVETQSGGRGESLVKFTFISADTDTASEASSSLSRSSSRGDADLKRDGSLRGGAEREAGSHSLSKAGLKARSMFDLSARHAGNISVSRPTDESTSSNATRTPSVTPLSTPVPTPTITPVPCVTPPPLMIKRPEVTGVSPCDGPVNSASRLTLRGSNLGVSAADIVSVTVTGYDVTSSVEYDSPSRLTCSVGPLPGARPGTGNVIVTTRTGGVGSSAVQFRFTEPLVEAADDEFAAVPYSLTAEEPRPAISTAGRVKLPPPVVEIQPMSRRSHSSPHHKAPAPVPPPLSSLERGDADSQIIDRVRSTVGVDTALNNKITELTNHLVTSEDQVKRLQQENKMLREENERMRQYMESLVSKAISSCPQILCVDMSKLPS